MTEKEALARVKTGNFNGGRGFDMQLLVDSVGIIGEMFKSGQISEVVRCKECKYQHDPSNCFTFGMDRYDEWFCADGKRRDNDA